MIGRGEESQEDAVDADGGLDHVRDVAGLGGLKIGPKVDGGELGGGLREDGLELRLHAVRGS